MKQLPKNKENLFKNLGVNHNNVKKVNTVEDLLKEPPLMVLGQVRDNIQMNMDKQPVKLKKGTVLTMPLSTFLEIRKTHETKRTVLKPFRTKFSQIFKRYRGQDLSYKRILIWRGGGFGDLCFIMPIIKKIKKLYPTCQITTASYSRFVPIYADYPPGLVDKIVPVPFSHKFLFNNHYHLTFEGAVERTREAEHLNVYDLLAKVAGLDIDMTDDDYKLELCPNPKILEHIKNVLPDNYVVFQIRASSPIRMMSHQKWAKIIKGINDLGKKVVFIDRPNMSHYYKAIIENNNLDKDKVFNMSGISENINFATAIISKSDGVIGVDSAFTHMGSALNKPVVGIYASFRGHLRMKYYKNAEWVEPTEKRCEKQPCFYHGNEKMKCPAITTGKHPFCFESINEEEVIEKFKRLLENL